MSIKKIIHNALLFAMVSAAPLSSAENYEVTAFVGQMYGSDLADGNDAFSVDAASSFGLALAWQEGTHGQGQILVKRASHDFTSPVTNQNDSLAITYAHFNGVAMFRQHNYITTMSIGLGGAYFDAESGSEELYPSASIAIGTRYVLSQSIAFVTELRAYASLVDTNDNSFCRNDLCSAEFEDSIYTDSNISIGIAVKF